MLSSDLLKQIRTVQLRAGHLATDILAGEYTSAFKGRGMQFDEVREYVVGDDVRSIDWNVTARMNGPFVKVYREEREMTLILMVDVSPSQYFGGSGRMKKVAAAELSALLAFLAIRSNDRVGLILFSDHVEQFIPPKKGRSHVWQIIRAVLAHEGKGKATRIDEALEFMLRVVKRRSLCVVVSDFLSEGFEKPLRVASTRHELVCARVTDPLETSLVDGGIIEFRDSETGDLIIIDTGDRKVRERFATASVQRDLDAAKAMRRLGVDSFTFSTAEMVTRPLMAFLRQREARKGRKK